MLEKTQTLKKLYQEGVQIFTKHKAVYIDENVVYIANENNLKTKIEGIHKIIVAAGMKSYIPFELGTKIPVHFVGDAKSLGKAGNAIHDAYKLALVL